MVTIYYVQHGFSSGSAGKDIKITASIRVSTRSFGQHLYGTIDPECFQDSAAMSSTAPVLFMFWEKVDEESQGVLAY